MISFPRDEEGEKEGSISCPRIVYTRVHKKRSTPSTIPKTYKDGKGIRWIFQNEPYIEYLNNNYIPRRHWGATLNKEHYRYIAGLILYHQYV